MLDREDVELLMEFKKEYSGSFEYMAAIEILLDSSQGFYYYYNKMPIQQQQEFMEYPIYNLVSSFDIKALPCPMKEFDKTK